MGKQISIVCLGENLSCLPLGLCQSSWKLHGWYQEPGHGCALEGAPWVGAGVLCVQLHVWAFSQLSSCIKANACSASCCQGMSTPVPGAAPQGPLLPAKPWRAAPVAERCPGIASSALPLALAGQPSHDGSSGLFPCSWKSSPFQRVISPLV